MNTYISGTLVRSIANFTNAAGQPADPTTTVFKYRPASGAVQTPVLVHDGAGAFHYDIDTSGWTGPGLELYSCQWQGTGNVQAVGIDYFQVEPPAL